MNKTSNPVNTYRQDKADLRKTNTELMNRLKQIWNNYKTMVPIADNLAASAANHYTTIEQKVTSTDS